MEASGKNARLTKTAVEDTAEGHKRLIERIDALANAQVDFLIGASPTAFVDHFISEECALALALVSAKGLVFDKPNIKDEYITLTRNCFNVWLSSRGLAAKWVSEYLNFQHQTVWVSRVSDDVRSIQQALHNWLQPPTDAAAKRAGAWATYRKLLVGLPDLKETMFAETFGVRKVFVQPIAQYKVAGMGSQVGAKASDVANLIAGLISERVPGDELILLCGGPGSGKSTLCRVIASELATNKEMHPVFLRLRRLQDTQEIANFVETHLQKEGLIDKLSDLAQVPNLVLILDGFDELVMASRNRLREFFNTLREGLSSGPLRNAKAIVSGRDTRFPNGLGLPTGSHVISLLPFDHTRIKVWGKKWRSLHKTLSGKDFQPEVFYDERADQPGFNPPPLHHLVSWPLTLHLVARVHSAGALNLAKVKHQAVEKAILYRSIVSKSAQRQHEKSAAKGGLSSKQMRAFVQAISWEMYSTSRDALDYSEGLPLLKGVLPTASESELADLAEIAIVNQPQLTKGEQGGFEFVHKSFSEYFVAERFAFTIERVAFKSKEYGSGDLTWRMSLKEALGELSSLIAIRVITAEVQEMLEPMLVNFGEFGRAKPDGKLRGVDLVENLQTKKNRVEELIRAYITGNHQGDVVDPVRSSKIVKNERDIHANFSVGILVLGCALAKRLIKLRPGKEHIHDALFVEEARLWKIISIIQAGEINFDQSVADRCLSPLRIGSAETALEVLYPPFPRGCFKE